MLPRPINGICLSPFLNGTESPQRYLVEAGARSFIVNFRMLVLIEALQLASEPAGVVSYIQMRTNEVVSEEELLALITRLPPALFDHRIASEYMTPITCRVSLIPAGVVELIAARTAHLFAAPFLTAFMIVVVVAIPFAFMAARASLPQTEMAWGTLGMLGLGFMVSAIVHELGHASAVARNGVSPGHIGFGLYWFFPVFYTDVNAAWKLPPRQRIMVDLGGIYFQLLLVAGLTPLAFMGPAVETMRLLILFNLYSVLQNLNPIFKMDGYWLLADVAQIPNLHGKTFHFWQRVFKRSTAGPKTQLVFVLYGFAVCSYFGYLMAILPGAIRLQLLPRMRNAGVQMVLCTESFQHADWSAAFGQLGLALKASLVPAIALLTLFMWLASLWRRFGTPVLKTTGRAH